MLCLDEDGSTNGLKVVSRYRPLYNGSTIACCDGTMYASSKIVLRIGENFALTTIFDGKT